MECRNHPQAPAVARCSGCAEPFCGDCLVEIHGQKYCASCKNMAIKGPPVVVEEATIPCKEATEALTYAIVGIFCCGIILEPYALMKAREAKRIIEMNPQMTGSGKATAATVIAIVGLIFWLLGTAAKIANIGNR